MDRMTKAYGEGDQDVMNMRAGIDGLVFDGWSDAEIAAAAVEMAQDCRRELNNVIAKDQPKKEGEG